jgi:hypothetical protein
MFDKALVRYLLYFYAIAFVLSSASSVIAKLEGFAYKSFSWAELIGNTIIRYAAKFVFVFLAIFLVRYLLQNGKISKWAALLFHGFFGVVLTFYSVVSQVILNNWVFGLNDPVTWEYVYSRAILGTDYNFFLYFCSAAIVYAYDYFRKQKNFELKESTLKAQLLDSKINLLQSQLQPHFLFNTLNNIASLVDNNPERAQDSITDLSDMLRQTLQLHDTKFIPLEEEIQLLQKYLDIEKVRFDEKLTILWNLDSKTLTKKIPPLIFQPILENSLKHGFSYTHDHLEIKITTLLKNDYLECVIQNNGQKLPSKEIHYGIGLSNIIARLDTLYGDNFEFEMKNLEPKNGVITIFSIPT